MRLYFRKRFCTFCRPVFIPNLRRTSKVLKEKNISFHIHKYPTSMKDTFWILSDTTTVNALSSKIFTFDKVIVITCEHNKDCNFIRMLAIVAAY